METTRRAMCFRGKTSLKSTWIDAHHRSLVNFLLVLNLTKLSSNFCLMAWLFISVLLLTYLQPCFAAEPPKKFLLNSTEPYQAVHVPFVLRDGGIFIKAKFADTLVECQFDTGSDENSWDATLNIAGKETGTRSKQFDILGHQFYETQMILRSVKLGNYEVFQVNGFATDYRSGDAHHPTPESDKTPLLTNSAFLHVVVTIDYFKNELIVRSPEYDFLTQVQTAGSHVLPFEIVDAEKNFIWGCPMVQGTVNGRSARLVLDTGWNPQDVGIYRPFATKTATAIPKSGKGRSIAGSIKTPKGVPPLTVQYANGQVALTNLLPITIGKGNIITAMRRAQIINSSSSADGVFGYDILRQFRVTIDYPRRRVFLELYQPPFEPPKGKHWEIEPTESGSQVFVLCPDTNRND